MRQSLLHAELQIVINYFVFFCSEFQLDFDFDRNLLLFFNSTQRRQCFDVSIIDDEVYETDVAENLTLRLQLAAGNPLSVGIETDHSVAVISILDNDPFPTTTTTTMRRTTPPILTSKQEAIWWLFWYLMSVVVCKME